MAAAASLHARSPPLALRAQIEVDGRRSNDGWRTAGVLLAGNNTLKARLALAIADPIEGAVAAPAIVHEAPSAA
jgi:hypothetical protein